VVIESACAACGEIDVTVHDTGDGISLAAMQRLFDPFFTTKEDGLGMGLSISRSIIEAHGGRLFVPDNSDGGATFRFTLPISLPIASD